MVDACDAVLPDDSPDVIGCNNKANHWPVTSNVTGVTYRNEHCAKCHGLRKQHILRWNVLLFCREESHIPRDWDVGVPMTQLVQHIENHPGCAILFHPPIGIRPVIAAECMTGTDNDIKQPDLQPVTGPSLCNPGNKVYNITKFPETCAALFASPPTSSPTSPASPTTSLLASERKQLFCAMCTNYQRCMQPADDRYFAITLFPFVTDTFDRPFPFVLVMSESALLDVTANSARTHCACAPEEVYDEFENKCRALQCTSTRTLKDRSCVPSFSWMSGQTYDISLRLLPLDVTRDVRKDEVEFLVYNVTFATEVALGWLLKEWGLFQFHTLVLSVVVVKGESERTVLVKEIRLRMQGVAIFHDVTRMQKVEEELLNTTSATFFLWFRFPTLTFQAQPWHVPGQGRKTNTRQMTYPFIVTSRGNVTEYVTDLVQTPRNVSSSLTEDELYLPVKLSLTCPKVTFTLATHRSKIADDATDGEGKMADDATDDEGKMADDATENLLSADDNNNAADISKSVSPPQQNADHLTNSLDTSEDHFSDKESDHIVLGLDPETLVTSVKVNMRTGWLLHVPTKREVSFLYVDVLEDEGKVLVCADQLYSPRAFHGFPQAGLESYFSRDMIYVSIGCQSLSVVCLFSVLFTYCMFRELRTLPGKNTIGLVTMLFLAMLLYEVGVGRVEYPAICTAVGVAIHFCLMSAFTWMVICTAHMHRAFVHVLTSRSGSEAESRRLFKKHVIISLLVPALIVIATLTANYVIHKGQGPNGCGVDLGYGRGICYLSNRWSLLLASVGPICVVVVVNLGLFLVTVISLITMDRRMAKLTQQHRQQLSVFVRLSTLTGINWLCGLLTSLVDSAITWYAFDVMCGLQGLYVFFAFVCNGRVAALYRAMMCGWVGREGKD